MNTNVQKTVRTPTELFVHNVRTAYSGERQIGDALDWIRDNVRGEVWDGRLAELNRRIRDRQGELERIAGSLDLDPKGFNADGIDGTFREMTAFLERSETGAVRDVALIGYLQVALHQQIAVYDATVRLARTLDLDDVAIALDSLRERAWDLNDALKDLVRERIERSAALA